MRGRLIVLGLSAGLALLGWGCDSDESAPAGTGGGGAGGAATDATSDGSGGGGDPDGGGPDVEEEVAAPDAGPEVTPDAGPVCGDPTGERPSRRSEHSGVFDPVGQQLVMFGGSFAVPINCGFPTPTFETETWIYDVACDDWHLVDDGGEGPSGRVRHMTAYDSQRRRMILFGGRSRPEGGGLTYTLYNDVWAFDIEAETWEQLPSDSPPAARVNGALVYDPDRDRLVLFGGNSSTSGAAYTSLDDVYTYSFETGKWTFVPVPGAPSSRLFMSAIWDSARQRMVIHGGADETAFNQDVQYFDDLWALDYSGDLPQWQRLAEGQALKPVGRFWGGMVYDAGRDRYVLFGGHDNGAVAPDVGNKNDLWTFDPEKGNWEQHSAGDVWNAPALGFCSFPPDFTNIVEDFPERRNAAVFVAGADAAYVSGGKTDCGVVDDLFRLDLEALSWQELTTATVGEVCLRKGGLNCNDLVLLAECRRRCRR